MFFFALSTSCLYWEVLRVMCSLHFCLNKRITIFWLFFWCVNDILILGEILPETLWVFFVRWYKIRIFWLVFLLCQRHVDRDLCGTLSFHSYLSMFSWKNIIAHLFVSPKKTFSFQLILARGFLYKVAIRSLWQKSPWCFILETKKYRNLGYIDRSKVANEIWC